MRNVFAFIAITVILAIASPVARGGIVESIEAVVNGQPITTGELERFIERQAPSNEIQAENRRQQRLEELINRILLVQEAKKRGLEADDSDVKLEVRRQMTFLQNKLGNQLQDYLQKLGGTLEDVERDTTEVVRQQIMYDRMRGVATSGVSVTDEDIQKFQADHPNEFAGSDTVRVWHIVLYLPDDATEEQTAARHKEAMDLVVQSRSGLKDFRDLARANSEYEATREIGGDLGQMSRGQLLKEYDVVFDMKAGEVTDPMLVETSAGKSLHILQVGPRTTVRDHLLEQRRTEELTRFITELRKNAKIRVKSTSRVSALDGGSSRSE